jgi:hypothetical protein
LHAFDLKLIDRPGRVEQPEIDTEVAADMGQQAVDADILRKIARLAGRLFLGTAHHERQTLHEQEIVGIPAGGAHKRPGLFDLAPCTLRIHGRDERPFGVACREGASGTRRSGLEQDRRSLRRRLAQMRSEDLVALAAMMDAVNFRRVRV